MTRAEHIEEGLESLKEDWELIRTASRLATVIEHAARHLGLGGKNDLRALWTERAKEIRGKCLNKEQINILLLDANWEIKKALK